MRRGGSTKGYLYSNLYPWMMIPKLHYSLYSLRLWLPEGFFAKSKIIILFLFVLNLPSGWHRYRFFCFKFYVGGAASLVTLVRVVPVRATESILCSVIGLSQGESSQQCHKPL